MYRVKNVFTLLFITLVFCLYTHCKGGDASEKARQDSLRTAEKMKETQDEKKKNIYLIEPPDTNYTGEYLDKYDNGIVKFKGSFRFGKRHGQWMAFYPNGLLWSECFYTNGLRDGANTVYYENGLPNYKGWFKNDLRDSTWIFYDQQGNELRKVKFKNDEEVPK